MLTTNMLCRLVRTVNVFMYWLIGISAVALAVYASFFHESLRDSYIDNLFFEKHLINKDEWVSLQLQITFEKWFMLFIADVSLATAVALYLQKRRNRKKSPEYPEESRRLRLTAVLKLIFCIPIFLVIWVAVLVVPMKIFADNYSSIYCEIASWCMLIAFFIYVLRLFMKTLQPQIRA